ncbi:hypothetical protein PMAYCL1PPCAC_21549, partial [Pristionchus mayeri]
ILQNEVQMSAFTAIDPHTNRTVWIPFFIRAHRLPEEIQTLYPAFVAAEVLGQMLALIACSLAVFVYYRVCALHFNLAQTILNAIYVAIPFVILRFPLILMETGVIRYESLADDVIIIISLIRAFLFVSLYNFEINIAVERYFALKYVRTYEKVKRRHISLIILTINNLYSLAIAYLLTYDYIHGFIYVALTCVANNFALVTFLHSAKKNELIRMKLIQFRRNDASYTISYRWQLQDNARSARELRILMIGCNCIINFILPVMFVPALIFDHDPAKSGILEAAKLFYQVISAYVFVLSAFYLTFIIQKHRDYIFGVTTVEEFTHAAELSRTDNRMIADTEKHFIRLSQEWKVDRTRKIPEIVEITIN